MSLKMYPSVRGDRYTGRLNCSKHHGKAAGAFGKQPKFLTPHQQRMAMPLMVRRAEAAFEEFAAAK